ncbi:MAG: FAD-dependent monooxygenase [Rhodococcus sp. (in: high G+C Gram-positive bacteria)]
MLRWTSPSFPIPIARASTAHAPWDITASNFGSTRARPSSSCRPRRAYAACWPNAGSTTTRWRSTGAGVTPSTSARPNSGERGGPFWPATPHTSCRRSPGQGVSSGVRDVANLCWKLDAVLNAHASPSLLDTYEPERRPNVQQLTDFSLRIGKLVMLENPTAVRMRVSVIRAAMKLPTLGPLIKSNGLKPRYQLGTTGGFFGRTALRRSPRGSFIAQPWVTGSDLTPVRLDTVLDNKWTWVGFPSAPIPTPLAEAGVHEVKLEYSSAVAVHDVAAGHYVDSEGTLERQMHRSRARGFLVRPDKFIYASDREISSDDYARVAAVVEGLQLSGTA